MTRSLLSTLIPGKWYLWDRCPLQPTEPPKVWPWDYYDTQREAEVERKLSVNAADLYSQVYNPTVVHTCSCLAVYTRETWHALHSPPKAEWQEDGEGGYLQYRNCSACGSTRARQYPATFDWANSEYPPPEGAIR